MYQSTRGFGMLQKRHRILGEKDKRELTAQDHNEPVKLLLSPSYHHCHCNNHTDNHNRNHNQS